MAPNSRSPLSKPDAHLKALVSHAKAITEKWAKRHEFWYDSGHKDPLDHYDTEPASGSSILTLLSEGPVSQCLNEGWAQGDELSNELEKIGVYIELDDRVTAGYYLIDHNSELQSEFDHWARWKWTCRLIEADTADVSGDIYRYFAEHPGALQRLPSRAFEELVSSVFTARGWKTKIGPGSGDGGVDVRMWVESPLGDALTLVQAKRYAEHRPIQLDAVAALEAHSKRESASGLFVTTSRYLPGVKEWASRNRQLVLADSNDLVAWCKDASEAALRARTNALALKNLGTLLHEVRARGRHPALVSSFKAYPSFCIVLRETTSGALLLPIPSIEVSGDGQRGTLLPVLDGRLLYESPDCGVFRAIRQVRNGEISYWGKGDLYHEWSGKPLGFDFWD